MCKAICKQPSFALLSRTFAKLPFLRDLRHGIQQSGEMYFFERLASSEVESVEKVNINNTSLKRERRGPLRSRVQACMDWTALFSAV